MITFFATCPNGHERAQGFYKDRLGELLQAGSLRLWCMKCDTHWNASDTELETLRRLLRVSE